MFSVLATTVAPLLTLSHPSAYADSCSLLLTSPTLKSQFTALSEPTAGEEIIIATDISKDCSDQNQPFLVIFEVRNSDGVTEYLELQRGVLNPIYEKIEIGMSWVPTHGGYYELHTFVISGLEHPVILSSVTTENIAIADNVGKAIVSIPFDPNPQRQLSTFEPEFIKILIGVNNTVIWTNGDNASHRLTGQNSQPDSIALDFERPIFLYPGYSVSIPFRKEACTSTWIQIDLGCMVLYRYMRSMRHL